jgi:hypothetical protein
MQKAGLEGEIARLDRQRAAHFNDQLNIRRQMQNARFDQVASERRIQAIGLDIARRPTTHGDAFAMSWEGRTVTDRRVAGDLLLSKLRLAERARKEADIPLGMLGGFDLVCSAGRGFAREFQASLVLRRAEGQEIQIESDLTPLGLIARLEHTLDRFELDLEDQKRRVREAATRFAGYEEHLGQPFPLQAELDTKKGQLAALETDLAQTGKQAA